MIRWLTCLAAGAVLAGPAFAGDWTAFDWVTVTDPGNDPIYRDGHGNAFDRDVGSVAYTYQMSRTELTWGQYAEFVTAYRPYWTGHPNDGNFTGLPIYTNDGGQTYQILPGYEHVAATPSWGLCALYANWLHNGKASGAWAFESGAYDTSDWVWSPTAPSEVLVGNFEHSPDARFWIPSEDEWIKAAYYDPNRYGEGQPGYWEHPNQSDEPTPADQTSASGYSDPPLPVGSYPDTQSPWGLLDLSGGAREWVSDRQSSPYDTVFITHGSKVGEFVWADTDWLFITPMPWTPAEGITGLRLAAQVPTPGTGVVLFGLVLWRGRR